MLYLTELNVIYNYDYCWGPILVYLRLFVAERPQRDSAFGKELMELSNVLMSPLNVSVFDGLPPNYTVKKGQFKQNVTSKFCRIQLILIVKLFLNLSYFAR